MPVKLTEEQVLQLAPDAQSVKAGKGLATPGKWVLKEFNERAIWGHCQGSGAKPYQTVINLQDIAFKCSCPSRKFPCKHGLGLLLLYAKQPELFAEAEEPEWVSEWLNKRAEKADKKAQVKITEEKPIDAKAQAKRQEKRHQNVLQGIEDLEIWLKDILRNGLLNMPDSISIPFNTMARRMVDAQAPGLSSKLDLALENYHAHQDNHSVLIEDLGRLYLLAQAYKHIEQLDENWYEEIRTQVGYPQSKEDALAGAPINDHWLVLHREKKMLNHLSMESYWLYGELSKRLTQYVNYNPMGSLPTECLVVGSTYEGELFLYKGVGDCRRALFKDFIVLDYRFNPDFTQGIQGAASLYREAMITNPLTDRVPLLVGELRITREGKNFLVIDSKGYSAQTQMEEDVFMDILTITGGDSFSAFVLSTGKIWELKSIWYNDTFYTWRDERY